MNPNLCLWRDSEQTENSLAVYRSHCTQWGNAFPFSSLFLKENPGWLSSVALKLWLFFFFFRLILNHPRNQNQSISGFSMALLTPFPQINSANALSDPLHQVCVRNKPSLNKTQPCPEGSAGLIHPGMAPAAALTLPLDTWGFATVSVTLKHLLSWSCCWNRGGAELQLAQGSPAGFVPPAPGNWAMEGWNTNPQVSHKEGTSRAVLLHPRSRSFTPPWGRSLCPPGLSLHWYFHFWCQEISSLSTPSPKCSPCLG